VSAFTLAPGEVAAAMRARPIGAPAARAITSVSIDSRTLRPGDLFFAIRGPRFDGHAFVGDAVSRGASAVVVSDPAAVAALEGVAGLLVGDTVEALQALASHVRRRSGARVVAITGSAGKTTTKEATAALLDGPHVVLRNRGNLNNHIGLPLSLVDLTAGAGVAVVELGMSHAGEIRQLVRIARPEIRVWTNVGTAHLEYFATQDAIAEAKAEILDDAGPDTVFVANADDPRVIARAATFPGRVVSFGLNEGAGVRAVDIEDRGFDGIGATVRTPSGAFPVSTSLAGRSHLLNVLAAIAVAVQFHVPFEDIAAKVASLRPAPQRGEVLRLRGDVTIIDDSYNSSPAALQQLIDVSARHASSRRVVAFLGEMLELGPASETLHRECGVAVAAAGIDRLVAVGADPARALAAAAIGAGLPASAVSSVSSSEAAAALVADVVGAGDLVLVKGSRGLRMERVVERLAAEFA
jgi:UDP-N-acetylmuramoyl-tripeptide--D-alanyl-D-alanine ligase